MSYPDKLQDLMDLLELYDSKERIDMLVDFAEKFREVPEAIARKPYPLEHKVPFCESGAYVWKIPQSDGTINLYFAVENPQGVSAKALSAILQKTLSGEKPEAFKDIPDDLVFRLFGETLSMGKNMGLIGIINMVKKD